MSQPLAQPQAVAPPVQPMVPGSPAPPTPGAVMGGYRFAGGDPASAASWVALNGDEYLKSLPATALPAIPMIKAYAEGRAPVPTSAAMRNPQVLQLLEMTQQYDPTFNGQDYASRAGTRRDFTSGKAAANITAFNTVLQHLDKLHNDGQALNNFSGVLTPLNGLINSGESFFGDPRKTNFDTDKEAVASELVRAFRGAGGAEADIQGWKDQFSASNSPEQLQGAVRRAVELLNGRIAALGDQYNRGMGRTQDPITLLAPEAQAVYRKLSGGESSAAMPLSGGRQPTPTDARRPLPTPQSLPRKGSASVDDLLKKYGVH